MKIPTVDFLIEKIAQLQSHQHDFYSDGMFASQRFHRWLPYTREDNNIYYPALIAFTLQKSLKYLTPPQQNKVKHIIKGITQNYPRFEGLQNPHLYNFYQTKPIAPYPNGYILSKFNYFILPEDADCTVLVAITNPENTSKQALIIRDYLIKFANLSAKKTKYALPQYAHLPAYGVWFGSGKMPIEIDICVLCNILCFNQQYQLPLIEQDQASFEFIRMAIESNDILQRPFALSSYYPNSSIILYHIARLWDTLARPGVHLPTQKIIKLIQAQAHDVSTQFEKMLLDIALLKMQVLPEKSTLDGNQLIEEFKSFPYFIASMPYDSPTAWLEAIKNHSLFHIYYKNTAYYYTLWLEYELLTHNT